MILVCPQCQSQYNLDATKLGAHGRTVRCASCHHTWFQEVEAPVEQAPEEQAQGEKVFDEILSEVSAAAVGAPEAVIPRIEEPAPESDASPMRRIDAALPPPSVITHNPFGVGASAFGILALVLMVSVTLALMIVARNGVARHWPQTALLYKTLGLQVKVPGEGFRLGDIAAEQRIDHDGSVLVVEGKVTNMTEQALDYPSLSVELRDAKQVLVRQWNVDPGVSRIASGETAPLMLQLQGARAEGKTVSVRVRGD